MPHPIDVHVGATLRQFRKQARLSQSELGERMGQLSFQQIQKYEIGTNRVSASKLWEASVALKCHPADFFDGLSAKEGVAEAGARQRALVEAFSLVPGVSRLAELQPAQHAALQTMIAAMLPG